MSFPGRKPSYSRNKVTCKNHSEVLLDLRIILFLMNRIILFCAGNLGILERRIAVRHQQERPMRDRERRGRVSSQLLRNVNGNKPVVYKCKCHLTSSEDCTRDRTDPILVSSDITKHLINR